MIFSAPSGSYVVQRSWLLRVGYLTGALLGSVAVLASFAPASAAQISQSAATTDQQEAVSTFKALQQNLYQSSADLYSGSPTNTCGTYSCLWPFTNATAGTVFLYGTPDGSRYLKKVAARLVGLGHYADSTEISPSGMPQPPAYQSAVAPPLGPGGSTYYDDNGWVGLDLIHAYHLTSNSTDLALAQDEFNFAISGWDTSTTDGCSGGVFWEDVAGSQRNATANGANAELGLELSRLTGNAPDLTWATRMYQWVVSCLGTPSGLYDDHVNSNGSVNTTIWSYNQGVMVGAGVLLYHATGNVAYLSQAEQTATAALTYFGTGSTLINQGPAFNSIYFRNLFLLNKIAPNAAYSGDAQTFASYMWTQRQVGTGLIDPQYGVNGTAPMIEIYSLLAGSQPSP